MFLLFNSSIHCTMNIDRRNYLRITSAIFLPTDFEQFSFIKFLQLKMKNEEKNNINKFSKHIYPNNLFKSAFIAALLNQ